VRLPDVSHGDVMRLCTLILVLFLVMAGEEEGFSGDLGGAGPLRHLTTLDELEASLPPGTMLMMHSAAIEEFLTELEGQPPDWKVVYGHGHHDPEHDDRLFALNRERDAKREGRPALSKQLAFAWIGTLSPYDPAIGGFPVAIGPKFIKTSWGMVRFKPEDAPGNLSVVTDASQRSHLQRLLKQGRSVEIDVVMTGRLIPEESIVYDFSHDEEGLGLIMPFVRVEQVDFVMARP
jgi:hypothetical protein